MLVKQDTMRDISLLMASVLTTGQTNVAELPEELPEPPESTQQQLKQNLEIEVAPSTEITPPEFVDRDGTLESQEQCNYTDCDVIKVRESANDLQFSTTVISDDKKKKHQNLLKKSRNKIQFQDSFSLSQKVEEKFKSINMGEPKVVIGFRRQIDESRKSFY